MSWPIAGLLLAACAVVGVAVGLVRSQGARRLLLFLAVAAALAAFVPVRCSTAQAEEQVGADPNQFSGQSSCSKALGWRLPEVASLDGDGPGYALALAGGALVLTGSSLVGHRRRRAVRCRYSAHRPAAGCWRSASC